MSGAVQVVVCLSLVAGVLASVGSTASGQATGTISTFAGSGAYGFTPDGPLSTSSPLSGPFDLLADSNQLVITDNSRVRAIRDGQITTIAGGGFYIYRDDWPANDNKFDGLSQLARGPNGDLYLADSGHSTVRKVTSDGLIHTVAGNRGFGFGGDNIPATSNALNGPAGIAFNPTGDLIIADTGNQRIRRVDSNGIITTIAGTGTQGYGGDNGPATSALLDNPGRLAFDQQGNLYVSDGGSRVRKISSSGIITTFAGGGTGPDGGPAVGASLQRPQGLAIDAEGSLYIAEMDGSRVRKVDTSGVITTVAGTGTAGYNGDGVAPTSAQLAQPFGLAFDSTGDLFIGDLGNSRIREIAGIGLPPTTTTSITSRTTSTTTIVQPTSTTTSSTVPNVGRRYVALGDSVPYGHGLANPQFYRDDPLHQSGIQQGPSTLAYPSLVAQQLGLSLRVRDQPAVPSPPEKQGPGCLLTGDQLTVSGASSTIANTDTNDTDCPSSIRGRLGFSFVKRRAVLEDQLPAARLSADPPTLVTIQAGANDVNFAGCFLDLLHVLPQASRAGPPFITAPELCFRRDLSLNLQLSNEVKEDLAAFSIALDDIISQVETMAPHASIAVINYYQAIPQPDAPIYPDQSAVCRDLAIQRKIPSGIVPQPNKPFVRFIYGALYLEATLLQTALNETIASVLQNGKHPEVVPVDISQTLFGHEMCTQDSQHHSSSWIFTEPWRAVHPTAQGQSAIAAEIIRACSNLCKGR